MDNSSKEEKIFCNLHSKPIVYTLVRDESFPGKIQEISIVKSVFNSKRWLLLTLVFYISFLIAGLNLESLHNLSFILLILLIFVYVKFSICVKKETLLLISSIGIQFTTTFATGRRNVKFIKMPSILDVAVNECITLHCIVYCLIFILHSSSNEDRQIYPIFQGTKPRLDCISEIYTIAKNHVSKLKIS